MFVLFVLFVSKKNHREIGLFGDFWWQTKASKNANKANNNANLSNKVFTNFVNADGDQIAYSDGYDEEKENLYVEVSTYNGTININ